MSAAAVLAAAAALEAAELAFADWEHGAAPVSALVKA